MTPTTALGLSIRLSMIELRETGDWDIFLGPPERARAETGGADKWVSKRRELLVFARVNKVTSTSLGYPLSVFNKNSTLKCSSLIFLKSGPEPWILDDFCHGNVISKYLSKLRFGTNKIQPELKCAENMLFSFYESLLRARLWEHELFSVRSIAFISSVVKSPDETCNNYKAFCIWKTRGCYIGCLVSTSMDLVHTSPVFEPYRNNGKFSE